MHIWRICLQRNKNFKKSDSSSFILLKITFCKYCCGFFFWHSCLWCLDNLYLSTASTCLWEPNYFPQLIVLVGRCVLTWIVSDNVIHVRAFYRWLSVMIRYFNWICFARNAYLEWRTTVYTWLYILPKIFALRKLWSLWIMWTMTT